MSSQCFGASSSSIPSTSFNHIHPQCHRKRSWSTWHLGPQLPNQRYRDWWTSPATGQVHPSSRCILSCEQAVANQNNPTSSKVRQNEHGCSRWTRLHSCFQFHTFSMRASDEKIGPENLGWAKGREDTGDALYILLDLMVQFDSISCPPDSQCPTHEMKTALTRQLPLVP